MRERLDRGRRVLATGLSFTVFGLGGVLIGLVAFPLMILFIRDRERRNLTARALIRRSFAGFVEFMRVAGCLTYEVHGRERLAREGLLVLANHPTLIDVVFLGSLLSRPDCIVKSALLRNPFTRGPIRAAGFVCNDEGAGLVEDCIDSVREGNQLIVFPEGTRTPRQGPARLQRGAANIAVRGRLNVTPVLIRCEPPTLAKGEKWYRVPPRRAHVTIRVLEDLPIGPYLAGERGEAMAARRLTEDLAVLFTGELHRARA